ncbi:recombinase family protein [Hymenobacter oligotrophus]|uniref:Recombinase family protein n=1 Tax=Hymenobacter oligotrophus TaxID=2319843 RepID=A0A3B7R0R9_9BACT|nr:recombinase family protein [Hymenobacter oligotrophus]AYA37575.1 recombinase family protein [Hymenobacter oligotrophus]
MKKYVAYYRVSTAKQGQSGLGLEAQQASVQGYVKNAGSIVSEFVEVESGKNNSRPQLASAIAESKAAGATLLIAKLDRLSRDAAYIMTLDVPFVAVDMPELNTLTKGIFASMAQHERELISTRTKAALQAKKQRGEALGNVSNLTDAGRLKGQQVRQENAKTNAANVQAAMLIELLREKGKSLREIANVLNASGYKTRRGCSYTAAAVQRLIVK